MKFGRFWLLCLFIGFASAGAPCWADSVIDAFYAQSPADVLRKAYELPKLQEWNADLHGQIVGWLDDRLARHFADATYTLSPLSASHPFFAGSAPSYLRRLEVELGMLYYLSRHSRSLELKKAFLLAASKIDGRLAEAVNSAHRALVQRPMELKLEYAERRSGNIFRRAYRNMMEIGELSDARAPYIKAVELPETQRDAWDVRAAIRPYEEFLGLTGYSAIADLPASYCAHQVALMGLFHAEVLNAK